MVATTLDIERICRRVRSWNIDAGIGWAELAEGVGENLGRDVPEGTLKSWLYGSRSLGLEEACAIADVFGKSLDELVCRDEIAV